MPISAITLQVQRRPFRLYLRHRPSLQSHPFHRPRRLQSRLQIGLQKRGLARAAWRGQKEAVLGVAENGLASQGGDELISQYLAWKMDQFIFKYWKSDILLISR